MKQGDLVVRQSYGGDVLFRIEMLQSENVILKGLDFRLLADAPRHDLMSIHDFTGSHSTGLMRQKASQAFRQMQSAVEESLSSERFEALNRTNGDSLYFEWPGKVLHLDGDANYLKKSMQLYESMKIPADGYFVSESKMAEALLRLLPQSQPDIVVITGHDGVLKNRQGVDLNSLSSYKNSQHFVNAVRVAREYERNLDSLIVVAGACQSHYEALLHAGANFASSPGRILIHALDPVYIAVKASYTPLKDVIDLPELVSGTISGIDGVGGIETFGRYRVGYPRPKTYA
ncbi:sporulation peptidase YabG [Paenibacillus montaniterrae]|uniref:Sporulation peptidase YabG n=1 Tax=Paenibacillus montaniterrae TaxID=429341 RepID=A0A919YX03_9BACL|nr:sporulation peptidase YabG [Paenibacillus montaniterrae]GIP19594.1 sporulation peptidase YabG [Paenibacillus montaniterrae]